MALELGLNDNQLTGTIPAEMQYLPVRVSDGCWINEGTSAYVPCNKKQGGCADPVIIGIHLPVCAGDVPDTVHESLGTT